MPPACSTSICAATRWRSWRKSNPAPPPPWVCAYDSLPTAVSRPPSVTTRPLDRLTIDLAEASLDPAPARGTIGTTAHLPPGEPLRLHVFLDRSVIEVFCGGRACLSARVYPTRPDSNGVQAFADGGRAALRRLAVWRKRSIGLYC